MMTSFMLRFVVLASLATVVACGKPSAAPADAPGAAPTVAHAPAGVVPGSHEDWCDEHAVAESLCTKCNPKLVAAFKATGDWCAEHGVPESQCRICHPDLKIVRPPKATP
jgi:hypothetical protein